jgi:hypothetical protein
MMTNVCIFAKTIGYPQAGGNFWAYLNWALGLRSCGCNVIWLEEVPSLQGPDEIRVSLLALKNRLKPFGFADSIALHGTNDEQVSINKDLRIVRIEDVTDGADLLLDMYYSDCGELIRRFRRSALIDIDPGLTQIWISTGALEVAPHDLYFTIGEHVGRPGASLPACGLSWIYTPPCIALEWWPSVQHVVTAPYTTVSQWYGEWQADGDQFYDNSKRAGFLPFLDLPKHVTVSLELAVALYGDDASLMMLREHGWSVREATKVSSTPWDYQKYIQNSRGEFSCVKPSFVRQQNAWMSDRTLCYLASAKPAVIQYTGPSGFLPDAAGLLRFRYFEDAIDLLNDAEKNYDFHSKSARALVEEFFDSKKVVSRVLERSL